MNYEVTIGIPVYNAVNFIRQTMDSVLAQTFASIEFLFVDDGSTDASFQVIQEYQQKHPRGKDIHVIRFFQNVGVSVARNKIIDEAQGLFLYFMDADDIIEPETIALLIAHQKKTGYDIVYGSYDKIETFNQNKILETHQYPFLELTGDGCLAEYAYGKYGGLQTTIWNYVVNIDVLRKARLRFIDTDFWEDMAFSFEMVTFCRNAVLLPDITYHYQCHYDSLSNYQERKLINKNEVLRNIKTVEYMKRQCAKTKEKTYQPQRCQFVLTTDFYVLCYILKNAKRIVPSVTFNDIKDIMRHPAKFSEIMRFKRGKIKHLLFWIIGKMPTKMVALLATIIGKVRGLT